MNSDGSGPDPLRQTENERLLHYLKTIEKAEGEFGWLRPVLDKLKTNEEAEGEFGWLRPGPS